MKGKKSVDTLVMLCHLEKTTRLDDNLIRFSFCFLSELVRPKKLL